LHLKADNKYWIASPAFDVTWIIAPHFLSVLLVAIWSKGSSSVNPLPLWAWIVGVLLVDVAHVYATLFRTYLHPQGRKKWSYLLFSLPIIVFLIGFLVYTVSGALIYWRCLAYIAAFHFIRQQYGFYKIYIRSNPLPKRKQLVDEYFLYSLMILPLVYWHTHLPRSFDWFVEGDFVRVPLLIWKSALVLWSLLFAIFLVSEIHQIKKNRTFNLPKNLLFIATAFSWMMGIIYFNGDFSFTLTNTFSHGIPYMALVAWTTKKNESRAWKAPAYVSIFLGLIIVWFLAYFEEGLWDQFVWHERDVLFHPLSFLTSLKINLSTSFWVAVLSVPQVTHYFLDGVIWKRSSSTTDLKYALK
jgi:hypothetical protein